MESQYLKTSDIAKILSITNQTVHALIRSGELKGIKVGTVYRVHRDDFEQYLKDAQVKS